MGEIAEKMSREKEKLEAEGERAEKMISCCFRFVALTNTCGDLNLVCIFGSRFGLGLFMRRNIREPNRVSEPKKFARGSGKSLYYTLASSTVLEKTSNNGCTRELDNVFLSAAKYGDIDILLRTLERHSININVRDETSGDTALILAARANNPKVKSWEKHKILLQSDPDLVPPDLTPI
eukprot:sb/3471757/